MNLYDQITFTHQKENSNEWQNVKKVLKVKIEKSTLLKIKLNLGCKLSAFLFAIVKIIFHSHHSWNF